MKKYLFILLAFLCFNNLIHSQAIGDWTIYMAYHNATITAPAGNLIYVLSDGSLYSYDTEDTSIQTYDKTNYLSDVNITNIAYSKDYKTLLIVYENSNIDLFINNEEVFNIPDFMNKSMIEDKTLNNISIKNEYAYLSTNFGIVIVNLKKKEIANTYNLGKIVYQSILIDKTIYAATKEGIFKGNITDNLLDNKNWELFNNSIYDNIIYYNNSILTKNSEGLFKYDETNQKFNSILNGSYSYMNQYDEQLILGNVNTVTIYNTLSSKTTVNTENTNHISHSNNIYWGSNGEKGLNGYKYNKNNNTFEKTIESIIPDSPRRNLDYYLTYTDRLLIAGGGIWGDRNNNPGTIMELNNNKWSYFEEGNDITNKTNIKYGDITKIIQDPQDPEHIFASSAGEGLYEFKNKKFIKLYNIDNSKLETIYPDKDSKYNYIRINGINFDKNNNLWMTNSRATNSIKILKENGEWLDFYHYNFTYKPTLGNIIFDQRGWAWIISMRSGDDYGIFCFNTNNTLENINDDQTIYHHNFINQDNQSISLESIFCLVEDKEGVIWIGTNAGPLIINNPTKIFESNSCTQIIVPRNDGSNLGDYLLEHEAIKAICIDGANRKWIGTENNGIYLLSSDGLETIHHFTSENSPLLSNSIQSITINPYNGEVFIGTDKGLVSYKSDATEAETSFNDDNVHAYPNPVRSNYDGIIAITGLVRDSDVKIVDISGKLIYSGTSVGGQFTWNGKNRTGKRVASGVYLVLATNSEGKEGIVTKITMIK